MREFETSGECYRLVDGFSDGRGEIQEVQIATYHAPMPELLDDIRLRAHHQESENGPRVSLRLEIGEDFRYGYDTQITWFRIGLGAYVRTSDRRVPVRVVRMDYHGFSTTWLYRDPRDRE